MNDKYRFFSTVAIWAAYTAVILGISAALTLSQAALDAWVSIPLAVFFIFLTAMAGFSTITMWRGSGQRRDTDKAGQAAKIKRDSMERLSRLVEDLDEQEIIELETLLLSREDEAYQ